MRSRVAPIRLWHTQEAGGADESAEEERGEAAKEVEDLGKDGASGRVHMRPGMQYPV